MAAPGSRGGQNSDGCSSGGSGLAPDPRSRLLDLPDHIQLLALRNHLQPHERRAIGQACRALFDLVASTCEVMTLKDDMAQHALNDWAPPVADPAAPRPPAAQPPGGWSTRLLSHFPSVTDLRVACHADVLTLVVLNLLAADEAAAPRTRSAPLTTAATARVLEFAARLAGTQPRHAAALLGAIVKHQLSHLRYQDALDGVGAMADLAGRVPPSEGLLDDAQRLKQQAQGYPSAAVAADDVCAGACCALQARAPTWAATFADKMGSLLAAVPVWRWLVHFLLQPDAMLTPAAAANRVGLVVGGVNKIVADMPAVLALRALSPTCYDEVVRAVFDHRIATATHLDHLYGPANRSWALHLYTSAILIPHTAHRDGKVEQACASLIGRGLYSDVVHLSACITSQPAALDLWSQLEAAAGAQPGWECMMTASTMDQLVQVVPDLPEARRPAAYAGLVRLALRRGLVERALALAALAAQGAGGGGVGGWGGDAALWAAVQHAYRLNSAATSSVTLGARTLEVVLQVAQSMSWGDLAADVYVVWCRGMAKRGQLHQALQTVRVDTLGAAVAAVAIGPAAAAAGGLLAAAAAAEDKVWCCLCALFLAQHDVDGTLDAAARVRGRGLLGAPPAWAWDDAGGGDDDDDAVVSACSMWQQLCDLVAASPPAALARLLTLADVDEPSRYVKATCRSLLQRGQYDAVAAFLGEWCTSVKQWQDFCAFCGEGDGRGGGGGGGGGSSGWGNSAPQAALAEVLARTNHGPHPQVTCSATVCMALVAEAGVVVVGSAEDFNSSTRLKRARQAAALLCSLPAGLHSRQLDKAALLVADALVREDARREALDVYARLGCRAAADVQLEKVAAGLDIDGAAEALSRMGEGKRRARACWDVVERMLTAGAGDGRALGVVGRLMSEGWRDGALEAVRLSSAGDVRGGRELLQRLAV